MRTLFALGILGILLSIGMVYAQVNYPGIVMDNTINATDNETDVSYPGIATGNTTRNAINITNATITRTNDTNASKIPPAAVEDGVPVFYVVITDDGDVRPATTSERTRINDLLNEGMRINEGGENVTGSGQTSGTTTAAGRPAANNTGIMTSPGMNSNTNDANTQDTTDEENGIIADIFNTY